MNATLVVLKTNPGFHFNHNKLHIILLIDYNICIASIF